jgi:beta-N-acetylhexosaminidase
MSPEAKVGQLVLISFPGTDVGPTSDIGTLIRDYSVGGILVKPENGNFGEGLVSFTDVVSMTSQLQSIAWSTHQPVTLTMGNSATVPYRVTHVPLLIGVEPTDFGAPPTAYITGTSALPTPLAIGATWNPELATSVGAVLAQELTALGFNMYLGPDLNVLYTPRPGDPADLGTAVFGGDPFWVGEMGTAYIRGLHEGSEGHLLVAPRHLPGLGSADRPLEEEVPTVQKPLEQLQQIELAPFFAASSALPGADQVADAFVVTHIRYRGFQGNIRQTTRPISLDAQALKLVTSLEEVRPWRESGGVLIADNLGLSSVHRFYDPTGVSFNARQITQDALSAGNDLLVLDRFSAERDWDQHFVNIRDTLRFLASRYKDDPAFQRVVDNAVYRILQMKFRMYPADSRDAIIASPEEAEEALGHGEPINSQVALNALNLISPLSDDQLPPSPQAGESIVIFTQEQNARWPLIQESSYVYLDQGAIEQVLLRLYGPEGTDVLRRSAIRSFSFEELNTALNQRQQQAQPTPTPVADNEDLQNSEPPPIPLSTIVLTALNEADWVIFAPTGLNPSREGASFVLKRFLAEQANILDARLAVLAFGPPYELDSTEVSKLDLYYGLFSTGSPFVDVGARAIFRDLVAPGDSPVSIPSLNYLISNQTMPDSEQLISFNLVNEAGAPLTTTAQTNIHVGDLIRLRTDPIVDRNGHLVPDGTPVQFKLSYPQEGIEREIVSQTSEGVAEANVNLERVGQLDITVQSEPAVSSIRLELMIQDDGVTITEIEPTPTPTATPTPTPTMTPTATPTPEPAPTKRPQLPEKVMTPQPSRWRLFSWGMGAVGSVLMVGFFWARQRSLRSDMALRLGLYGALGGLCGYVVVSALARWWMPAIRYGLVEREYLMAAVALTIGALTIMGSALWSAREKKEGQAKRKDRARGKSRTPGTGLGVSD